MKLAILYLLAVLPCSAVPDEPAAVLGHPRLYFTAEDLPRLRGLRSDGLHARIWRNLDKSARWCLTQQPRSEWIAPVSPDPIYENLYDRFYGIMRDVAITEHLAFAYAYSGEKQYGEAARRWIMASCRTWKREADGEPDGAKAYAVMRLMKGVAVGYDLAYDQLSDAERDEVRDTLVEIGQKYYEGYFSTPTISGPGFHTHHAVLEYGSFGVAALALWGEAPECDAWLAAVVKKFEEHLLPTGLADDGAQVEGATFWASTMHYRLFFMDALRRVTGRDLFDDYREFMNADLALASIAAEKQPGYNRSSETVVLEPSYGQLDYYAPVLLYLAREYRRPVYQHLSLWDHSLGRVQKTRYVTPSGEQLLFELGGYAYAWYDPSVPAGPGREPLSYQFPSIDEAYLRASWRPNDLLVGVRKGYVVVHAGGRAALVGLASGAEPAEPLLLESLEDDGTTAVVRFADGKKRRVSAKLQRPGRVVVRYGGTDQIEWSCHGKPVRSGNTVTWRDGVIVKIVAGELATWEPSGYAPQLAVGFGKLALADPAPQDFPRATVRADDDGEIVVEIRYDGASAAGDPNGAAGASADPQRGAGPSTSAASDGARSDERNKNRPLRVCLVSGSLEYNSDASLTAYQKYLEMNYAVECSRAFRKAVDDLPGLEALDSCDVMLLFTRRMTISGEQLERVKEYCRAGRPLVGVRTASHAFQNWLELDKEVLGGNYKSHFGEGPVTEVKIVEAAKDHPILAGVKPFGSIASLYRNTGVADDVELLLTGTIPGHTEPLAWTRIHNGGRIFYTSLGHPKDFENEVFRRMLANALFWTAEREPVRRPPRGN